MRRSLLLLSNDRVQIDVLGVAEITTTSVAAWNMDGKPDSGLADQVKAVALGGYNDVSFKFGKKNRILVVRSKGNNYPSFMQGPNRYVNGWQSSSDGNGNVQYLRITAEPTESTVDIFASLEAPTPAPIEVKFVMNQPVKGAWGEFEVNSYKETKPQPNTYPYFNGFHSGVATAPGKPVRWWNIVISTRNLQEGLLVGNVEAYDGRGDLIRYVDQKNRIVTSAEWVASLTNSSSESSKFLRSNITRNGYGDPIASTITTNIDPKQIKSLKIYASKQIRVKFAGIPLDPK